MDFQPNPSFQTGENGQKPSKMAIFDKKVLIKKKENFFSTYWSNKVCFPYPPLTSCQKSKKSDKIFRGEIFTQSNLQKWPKNDHFGQKKGEDEFSWTYDQLESCR